MHKRIPATMVATGAVALGASIGFTGGPAITVAIGVALAENNVSNDVEAYIQNATVTTTSGGVSMTASGLLPRT